MIIRSEEELINFGRDLGQKISAPCVIELIGDVGAGKTTFTRGLAKGLGATEPVTSPSFTISKRYTIKDGILAHYDFYRLPDPGIMSEDLAESIADPHTITVVEWANTTQDILPSDRLIYEITTNDDGTRTLTEKTTNQDSQPTSQNSQPNNPKDN